MEFQELKERMEAYGYSEVKVKRWKKHDWLTFKHLPDITYGRIGCTCRVEDVPESSWGKLFVPGMFTSKCADLRRDE